MELAEGGDFYDYLQDNEVSEEEAKEFFRQIIGGVAYAHRNLITHRDLKPENILIDYRKRIKIIDFGLSNRMADGKSLKTNCGSPNYAAPEVVGERLYEGTTVDVWSCGVILFAMLTESLPFEAETASLLYRKIEGIIN